MFFLPLLWRALGLMPTGVVGGEVFAQQDTQYSQYMFNQLALNPALAGSRDCIASSLVSRNQWVGLAGAPKTVSLSVHIPFQKKRIGLGAEIISEKIGPKSTNALLVSYAYRIPFSKGKLSFGLRTGIYNYAFDWTKMDYKDQQDVYNTGTRDSKFTGSGDFGLYYYARTFYCGMGLNHLTRGKILDRNNDLTRQVVHFFIPIGKAFQVGNTVINPSLLLKGASNSPGAVDINLNVLIRERCWLGISTRSDYGFVFLTQFLLNDQLKIGYSFDYGLNQIGVAGKGSHEIMIGYDFNLLGSKMILPRYL